MLDPIIESIACDPVEVDLVELVSGCSMDVDVHNFDIADEDEIILSALDTMIAPATQAERVPDED